MTTGLGTISNDTVSNGIATLRGRGRLDLRFRAGADGGGMDRAFQSGCLRVRLPRLAPGAPAEAVVLNTAGGLCDGDRLEQKFVWAPDAIACVTTQAAEKVYRAPGGGAAIATTIEVGAGATAEWLPQETILFDNARLTRSTEVSLAGDAHFLGCEAMVLGRTAMGESVRHGLVDDRWRIRLDGRLVYAEALRLDGPVAAMMARAAIGAGHAAFAVLIHVTADAVALLDTARRAIASPRGLAAATAYGPILVARLLARTGADLRADLLPLLAALRGGRPAPRVWSL